MSLLVPHMEQIEDVLDDEVIESSYVIYHHYLAKW